MHILEHKIKLPNKRVVRSLILISGDNDMLDLRLRVLIDIHGIGLFPNATMDDYGMISTTSTEQIDDVISIGDILQYCRKCSLVSAIPKGTTFNISETGEIPFAATCLCEKCREMELTSDEMGIKFIFKNYKIKNGQ